MPPLLRTSESVTIGHVDKICDQIADALLDEYLKGDPASRVAIEVMGSHGLLVIAGEVTSRASVAVKAIAEEVYGSLGYGNTLEMTVRIKEQSRDIAQGVDVGGAGDQGIMYGYATDETPEMLPKPFILARRLTERLTEVRVTDPAFKWLGPDGKSQVTMEGDRVETVVLSAQHSEKKAIEEVRELLASRVINEVFRDNPPRTVLVNPTGRFVVGGFDSDTGLTGRKLNVDTYGGLAPVGGGAFSGKDPTKVDRSAAYMGRYLAKNIVKRFEAGEATVGLAYAIGIAEPVMVEVTVANPSRAKEARDWVVKNFDLTPRGMIEFLDLRKSIYLKTAQRGHFGSGEFAWERVPIETKTKAS
ncbi:MAG: methionine adenosyltransferase [Parcubacteria group bacterium]|nr:methionine adenosyltransferase [Parcubacteria group bacterium]